MSAASSLDEVFRFVVARPPIAVEDDQTITLSATTELQKRIRRALNEGDGKLRAARLAEQYVADGQLVDGVSELQNADALEAVHTALLDEPPADRDALVELIERAFDRPLDALAQDGSVAADLERVTDGLVAIKFAPGAYPQSAGLMDAARILHAIGRLASGRHITPDVVIDGVGVLGAAAPAAVAEIPSREVVEPEPKPQPPISKRKIPAVIDELMAAERRGDVQTPTVAAPAAKASTEPPNGLIQKGMRFLGFTPEIASTASTFDLGENGLGLTAAAAERLSEDARAVLETYGLDAERQPVSMVTMALHQVMIPTEEVSEGLQLSALKPWLDLGAFDLADEPSVPSSRGQVRPAGIGDLMVVRQQIKRYQGGEVGHIENVLRGETKEREHRRLERSEITTLFETETISEEEREHEQTERFELQREVSKTIETESNLQAGVTVSGSYGPSVEFSTSFEVSAGVSTSETSRVASNYAKDVTDKSLSRLVERIKQSRTEKLVQEVEERNLHRLSNEGEDHISGIYQWVDKVYEAQVFNYGKRLLFDMVIPEPAAFVLHTVTASVEMPDLPTPPIPFTIRPHDLTEGNYGTYVARYGAVGVNPPPSPYVSIAKTFEERSGDRKDARLTKAAELPITEGYQATSAAVIWHGSVYDDYWFEIMVGDRKFGGGYTTLNNLRGTIPVGMQCGRVEAFTLTIQVNCQRTQGLLDDWKLATYDAIRQAYLERVREYEDALAAAEAKAFGVEIPGRNPAQNRAIERGELQRASLELLTEQRFELFDATRSGTPSTYPYFDFDEARAEGAYIKFFEHAFEWPQMTYLFYPYFWGRKEHWVERFLTEDVDTQFAEFLKAGAARVVVPVRPGYEKAVLHYLETGQIWNGHDDPPEVTSPLYVSLVQEIKERTGSFDNEVAVGDPWDVIVPTSLVKLRQDDELPEWEKDEDGVWAPAG